MERTSPMQSKIEKRNHKGIRLKFWFSAPFIYAMIVPTVFLDFCMEVYHRICFPLYGLPYVRRGDFVSVIDRAKLPYLVWYEKLNCAYCGYVNGVLRYTSTIASETEKYWCGIRHAAEALPVPPPTHKEFLPYGDEKALTEFVERGRDLHTDTSKE
jgi:hypothetical protein